MREKPILSVTEISLSLKACVEQVFFDIRVRGEVSGVKKAASGHIYFSLKDQDSVLSAVAWRGRDKTTQASIEEGLEVVCTGKLSTYPGRSNYQMIVETAEPAGIGALLKLLNERKEKLTKEGLFDESRKKPLPYLPDVIGVITSPTGAVIRDIMHRLKDRFGRHVILWPVLVQGTEAAEQIANAIKGFNAIPKGGLFVSNRPQTPGIIESAGICVDIDETGRIIPVHNIALKDPVTGVAKSYPKGTIIPRPDVLIVARGGGSLEDLWAFNEEIVVRATAESTIPLISAVGHETDTTLIDYASDRRAPTPTAAAEMAVPVKFELLSRLNNLSARQNGGIIKYLSDKTQQISLIGRAIPKLSDLINMHIQRLDDKLNRLKISLEYYVKTKENQFVNLKNLLKSYSYTAVLERGFSLVSGMDGKIVPSADVAKALPEFKIAFKDGTVMATPLAKKEKGADVVSCEK
ncbi:MAG: exodeoxyribonuclease VII large subunit, partial [Alphaproteobacteria bacterium]|nr:exodeoxyribonuclease VII large subunit [Alphaproteobacteria bacterium]